MIPEYFELRDSNKNLTSLLQKIRSVGNSAKLNGLDRPEHGHRNRA